jgi:hypothetical protein
MHDALTLMWPYYALPLRLATVTEMATDTQPLLHRQIAGVQTQVLAHPDLPACRPRAAGRQVGAQCAL